MKLSCPGSAVLESLGLGWVFFLPLCNYFPHSLKSCWNRNSKNMYPESSPHVLALWNTTTGISCCVLQEPAALCRERGPWRAGVLRTAREKLRSWGDPGVKAVPTGKGWRSTQGGGPPGAAENSGCEGLPCAGWSISDLLHPWWSWWALGKPRSNSLLAVLERVTQVQICKAVGTDLMGENLCDLLPVLKMKARSYVARRTLKACDTEVRKWSTKGDGTEFLY